MAKHPYICQRMEDDPHNPGWWRFSRPVLQWLRPEEIPFTSERRFTFAGPCPHAYLRQELRNWGQAHPAG